MNKHLEELCQLSGVSGDEGSVSDYIAKKIGSRGVVTKDPLGNLLVYKEGNKRPQNKVLFCAHMDEVGFVVTDITKDGLARFATVGGIDTRVIIGKQIAIGGRRIPGVIGTKAVHLQTEEEKTSVPKTENLYIDIGAKSKEDAIKWIAPGDCAVFVSDFISFGNDFIKSKALDDRVGCACLLDIIDRPLEYDAYFAFTVQEEVGLRGAKTAAYRQNPDMAIIIETTTAADISGVSDSARICALGRGPVVSYMDRATIYDPELYKLAMQTAQDGGIACQTKSMIVGGNDAGAVHVSRGGIRTIALSLPCRYLHSPSCVIKLSDLKQTVDLAVQLFVRMAEMPNDPILRV